MSVTKRRSSPRGTESLRGRESARSPATSSTAIRATATRVIRSRTLRPTRTRGTASTATPGRITRPSLTPLLTRTRDTAPSATAARTTPTAAGAAATRIRIRRRPRASRPSHRSRTKQIRPPAGNRGGAAGVRMYQPVRLCPPGRTYCPRGIPFGWSRVAPFAERRPPHRSA